MYEFDSPTSGTNEQLKNVLEAYDWNRSSSEAVVTSGRIHQSQVWMDLSLDWLTLTNPTRILSNSQMTSEGKYSGGLKPVEEEHWTGP